MKSKQKKKIQWKVGGGFRNNLKDWRVILFVMLAFIAGITNIIQMFIIGYYSQIYIPLIWFAFGTILLLSGAKIFDILFVIMTITVLITDGQYAYRSIGIFLLMNLVLARNNKFRIFSISIIFLACMIISSVDRNRVFDIFSLLIQLAFALFCYYGFLYNSCKTFGIKPKLVYSEKEYNVMFALATQDKTQKEVAYELGISMADLARTLISAREKNHFNTNDMLLRQFAIEVSKKGEKNE